MKTELLNSEILYLLKFQSYTTTKFKNKKKENTKPELCNLDIQ